MVGPEIAYVMGASMFVRRAVYDRIGGMSEAYFLYYEELDWAKRLPPEFGLGTCLDSVIYHKEGQSIGTSSTERPSDTSLYYYCVSGLRFYWRHERRHAPVAAARVLWNLLGYARRRDLAAFRVTGVALRDFIAGRPRRGTYGGAEFRSRVPDRAAKERG